MSKVDWLERCEFLKSISGFFFFTFYNLAIISRPFWNDIGFVIILIQFSDKKAWMENSLTIEHKWDCWLWWAREPPWQRPWSWNIFIYSMTYSEKNTSMYQKRSTSFQENNNQNQFKIYSEKPRRGTTGTIESMQRSINSVQRNLGRDWSKLELGRWREGFRVF